MCGDCVELLANKPALNARLIFADPPFNMDKDYDVYRDRKDRMAYLDWAEKWIRLCVSHLHPTEGALWLALPDELVSELDCIARHGVHRRNWIIWHYGFGQHLNSKFGRSKTHLLYYVASPRAPFYADQVRVPSDRQLKYHDPRADERGRVPCDVWKIPRICGTFHERVGWHPCQMPLNVMRRVVQCCTKPGDLVLDPFSGSGTTLVAARELGRSWLGIDVSPDYCTKALERINNGTH